MHLCLSKYVCFSPILLKTIGNCHILDEFSISLEMMGHMEQKLLMGPWDPGPGSRMTGPKCWDPSTRTQTVGIGMFGSQVLGPTVPGPK